MEQGIAFYLSAFISNYGKSSSSDGFALSSLTLLIANKPNGEILGLMTSDRGKVGSGVMAAPNTSKPISIPSTGQIYPRIINI